MLIHTYLMVVPSSNGGPQVCEIKDWKNISQASSKKDPEGQRAPKGKKPLRTKGKKG